MGSTFALMGRMISAPRFNTTFSMASADVIDRPGDTSIAKPCSFSAATANAGVGRNLRRASTAASAARFQGVEIKIENGMSSTSLSVPSLNLMRTGDAALVASSFEAALAWSRSSRVSGRTPGPMAAVEVSVGPAAAGDRHVAAGSGGALGISRFRCWFGSIRRSRGRPDPRCTAEGQRHRHEVIPLGTIRLHFYVVWPSRSDSPLKPFCDKPVTHVTRHGFVLGSGLITRAQTNQKSNGVPVAHVNLCRVCFRGHPSIKRDIARRKEGHVRS